MHLLIQRLGEILILFFDLNIVDELCYIKNNDVKH